MNKFGSAREFLVGGKGNKTQLSVTGLLTKINVDLLIFHKSRNLTFTVSITHSILGGMSTTSSSSNANSSSKVGLASSTPSSPTTLPPGGHDSPNRGFGALPPTPTNQQNNKTATPQVRSSRSYVVGRPIWIFPFGPRSFCVLLKP